MQATSSKTLYEVTLACGDTISSLVKPELGVYRMCNHCDCRKRVTAVLSPTLESTPATWHAPLTQDERTRLHNMLLSGFNHTRKLENYLYRLGAGFRIDYSHGTELLDHVLELVP